MPDAGLISFGDERIISKVWISNKTLKLMVLPQAEAKGSNAIGLRLRQHRQYLTLVFFLLLNRILRTGW